MHLEGKSIAVTGGGGGIGRAVSLACAAEGANVVVADYGVALDGSDPSSEVADAVVEEIRAAGGEAVAVAGDVSQFDVGASIVESACDRWGSIDGVVCSAGVLRERMLFNMSEQEWDDVVAVHLKGHFNVYRAALARMRKQPSGGSLVGFTSGAFVASTAQANYSAAKGGVVSLTRSAAMTAASIRYAGRACHQRQLHRAGGPHPDERERSFSSSRRASPRRLLPWWSTCSATPVGMSTRRSTAWLGAGFRSGTSPWRFARCGRPAISGPPERSPSSCPGP